MVKGQMDLNAIYSYKRKLGYSSRSKMMLLAHVRRSYEFSPLGRVWGDSMTKGKTQYLICFESSGLVFMQVNGKGMFTNDNSFMSRDKFSQVEIEKRILIGGHYSLSQYNMKLFDTNNDSVNFTVYMKKKGIEWLDEYLRTTIDNLDYYLKETAPSKTNYRRTTIEIEKESVAKEQAVNVSETEGKTLDTDSSKLRVTDKTLNNNELQGDSKNILKPEFKFCAHCGNKMDFNDAYCKKCGTKADI